MRNWIIVFVMSAMLAAPTGVLAGGKRVDAEQVIDTLIDADIDLLDWTIFDAETDPNKLLGRPGQYISKATFWDARIGDPERGPEAGTIETFRTDRDLLDRMRYVAEIGRQMPMLVQYQFRRGLVLLRLNKGFTPVAAKEYERALNAVQGAMVKKRVEMNDE